MRNPDWHHDEIILALELYFSPNRGPIDSRNPNVVALSQLLNALPIFDVKGEKFRNPNGVSLKLSNFLALDPAYEGTGMQAGSKLDRRLFEVFSVDLPRLIRVATALKTVLKNAKLSKKIFRAHETVYEDDVEVVEGEILYRFHKVRERDRKLVKLKKVKARGQLGELKCEVCEFDFYEKYGSLGTNFIECHHVRPLYEYNRAMVTKLDDLALVCANCHRMLHRSISFMSISDLKKIIKNSAPR